MTRGRFGRQDRLIQERRHDTYEEQTKHPDGTVCPRCRALVHGGVWCWGRPNGRTQEALCPACRRIEERLPAGTVELSGEFLGHHRGEILNLIQNLEAAEMHQRPLERIMSIADRGGRVEVRTTGVHLARLIGESVSRSYKGELSLQYGDAEKTIRVKWAREA